MKYSKQSLFTIILLCLGFTSAFTQDDMALDKKAIETTVQNYFEGWLTGDTLLIGRAMHASCKLKNLKDGAVKEYNRAEYLGFFNRDVEEKMLREKY